MQIERLMCLQQINLFILLVRIWKPQRKILNTAFNIRILQSFIPIFNAKVTYLVRNIGERVGKDAFDISELMFACTLDMVCCKYTWARKKGEN